MTDTQILTIAIAVIFPVAMLIYSNTRVSDVKETLRAEMLTHKIELKADIAALRVELNNKLDHLLEVVSKHDQKLGEG